MIDVVAVSGELIEHRDLHLEGARAVEVHLTLVQVLLVLELHFGFYLILTFFLFLLLLIYSFIFSQEMVHIFNKSAARFVLPDKYCSYEVVFWVGAHFSNLDYQADSHEEARGISLVSRCYLVRLSIVFFNVLDEERDKLIQVLIKHK